MENPDVAAYVDAYVADFLAGRTNGAIAHFVIDGANEQRIAHDTGGQARGFARAGARLVLSGRREEALAEVAGHCQTETLLLPFEATDLGALPGITTRAEKLTGGIDILVNNAGISQRSLALDTDFEVYRRLMEVDFFAPLRLSQLVLPAMVKRESGALVNIASVAGKIGSPLRSGYCAANTPWLAGPTRCAPKLPNMACRCSW